MADSLADLPTPVAVLSSSALEHNLATMAAWCADHHVSICPHGKTTMAPQIFARQLAHGAVGLSAATPAQVRRMRGSGIARVMLANQLVQPDEIRWIAEQASADPGFGFSCWVDSIDGVDILQRNLVPLDATIDVYIEYGWPGGRGGCRTLSEAHAVARRCHAASQLRLVGVAGYEGAVAGDRRPGSLQAVRQYLQGMRNIGTALCGRGDSDRFTLTAGGSMFFDLVVEELSGDPGVDVLLRSGCYVAHDHGLFARNTPWTQWDTPLRPALTVWASVLSVQEGVAFLDAGRRDVSYDQGLPVALRRRRGTVAELPLDDAEVTAFNDQHAFLPLGGADLRVGDRVELGVSHPCTTFDKHRTIPVLDDNETVVDVMHTFF